MAPYPAYHDLLVQSAGQGQLVVPVPAGGNPEQPVDYWRVSAAAVVSSCVWKSSQ